MAKRLPQFWLATISEAKGKKHSNRHLVESDRRNEQATLCGAEKRGKGRRVDYEWWQMMPMTVHELLYKLRKNDLGGLCPKCMALADGGAVAKAAEVVDDEGAEEAVA